MNACFKCGGPALTEYCLDCLVGPVNVKVSSEKILCDKCGETKVNGWDIKKGLASWCGKCEPNPFLTFGFDEAIKLLKDGKKVKRINWGGYWVQSPRLEGYDVQQNYIIMTGIIVAFTKDERWVPATPYQEDMLAEDWVEVE